jgi:hypothetical protein
LPKKSSKTLAGGKYLQLLSLQDFLGLVGAGSENPRSSMGVSYSLLLLCSQLPPAYLLSNGYLSLSPFIGVSPASDGVGTLAKFYAPVSLTISPNGIFALIPETTNHLIRSVDLSTATVTTLAGRVYSAGSTNGIGTNSKFNAPYDVAISSDNSYALICDRNNHLIRKVIISTADVTTFAGTTLSPALTNGIGTNTKFNNPNSISLSPDNVYALVTDSSNSVLRKIIISTISVSTFAGTGFGDANGIGTNSKFLGTSGVKISSDGTFALFCDISNHKIRRVDLSTVAVTTLAGGSTSGSTNGVGTSSKFNFPARVIISSNNLYAIVVDMFNNLIRRIDLPEASVTTLAGSTAGFSNGIGTNVKFTFPSGADIFKAENGVVSVFVADQSNDLIRQIDLSTASTITFAGIGAAIGYDDGIGTVSKFNDPYGVDISSDGESALVCDYGAHTIRKVVISTSSVTTLAGIMTVTGSTNGIGTNSLFDHPYDVSISSDSLFALVVEPYLIRSIELSTASVSTLAGSTSGFVDGIGTDVKFKSLVGVSISPNRVFALISDSNSIRRLDISTGAVTTFVGSGTISAASDGIGTNAHINPGGISISPNGLFALVGGGYVVRYIDLSTASVTTLVGFGASGRVNGIGTNSKFGSTASLSISPDGLFAFVTDPTNYEIRCIDITTATVSTVSGSGSAGYQDGTGTNGVISYPFGISVAPDGSFALVVDSNNRLVRKLVEPESVIPTFQPTSSPTIEPTMYPTTPTVLPTFTPSSPPSLIPTSPSVSPTILPTHEPTELPTAPSPSPSLNPTASPTSEPTFSPSSDPSSCPTFLPTTFPTLEPTSPPTASPSVSPTLKPSVVPTFQPTLFPTNGPTSNPTYMPFFPRNPTRSPTVRSRKAPTKTPTTLPSFYPSTSLHPTQTSFPSSLPTFSPSDSPSIAPTSAMPSTAPSDRPTWEPSSSPSATPSLAPSTEPTFAPTASPTAFPAAPVLMSPSNPTRAPTRNPTARPTAPPSNTPTVSPTRKTGGAVRFDFILPPTQQPALSFPSTGGTALSGRQSSRAKGGK